MYGYTHAHALITDLKLAITHPNTYVHLGYYECSVGGAESPEAKLCWTMGTEEVLILLQCST